MIGDFVKDYDSSIGHGMLRLDWKQKVDSEDKEAEVRSEISLEEGPGS